MKVWSLALTLVDGVGPVSFHKLVKALGSPKKALEAEGEDLERVPGIKKSTIREISTGLWKEKLEACLKSMETHAISYTTWDEEDYPSRLKETPSPPPVLFYQGTLSALESPCITIVGTRKPSYYGRDMATRIARDLAREGFSVVSGLARGIDTAAHKGAIMAGKTVAVVGTGLDKVYPPENAPLAQEIINKEGAILSIFPPGTPPERGNFPRRNQIMAALAHGVVVIEAGRKSGAVITARYARELNRPVMGLPGPAGSSRTSGVHGLIKEGAYLIEGAEDILKILGTQPVSRGKGGENLRLSPREEALWEILSAGPLPAEIIAEKCQMTLQETYALLLEMEMKGLVASRRGGTYERRAP